MKAALELLQTKGVLAVTHGAIGRETGISRSTLYRHWPKLDDLRNAAFARATQGGTSPPRLMAHWKLTLFGLLALWPPL